MKRSFAIILVYLLMIGILTGCGPNREKIQSDFTAILDKPASEETINEATTYLDKYLAKMDEKSASEMVVLLEHYIIGFNQDGINYEDWLKKYEKYIDSAVIGLYKIESEEQKSPMAVDAVLQISSEELLQRTYDMEQFIRKNKDQELIAEDAAWLYGNYINTLVMGTNGTPIFDYKTNAFSEEAKILYAAFINKYTDTVMSWTLTEYFSYLDSIQYTLDYKDKISSKSFFDTCNWLVSESRKRVFQ